LKKKTEGDFFLRNIQAVTLQEAVAYYEAVHAPFERYGNERSTWLEMRCRFFQVMHAVYGVAIGRHPENPRPPMVHAQHYMDEKLAATSRGGLSRCTVYTHDSRPDYGD
jgi:hypothetical protein